LTAKPVHSPLWMKSICEALALSENDPTAAEEAYELTIFGALLEARAPQDAPDGP